MTKAELYALVERDRERLGIANRAVDAVGLSRRLGIDVEYLDFKTRGLRGIALVQNKLTLLSNRLTKEQRNFYACHELFHHLNHRELAISSFQCYDIKIVGTGYYEWEANEGTAEMLVPYKLFLQFVGQHDIRSYSDLQALQRTIAEACNVPLRTAALRFDSLKYELRQYLDGVPLNRIEVVSGTVQEETGICVKSFNELFPEPRYVRKAIDVWDEGVPPYA